MNDDQRRSYGLSLLILGISIGGLGSTLHVASPVKIAMSAASLVCSLGAIILFLKVTAPKRRPLLVGSMVALVLLVGAAIVGLALVGR